MKEFIIKFDDKHHVREWRNEYRTVHLETTTFNAYVFHKDTGNPYMMPFATKVTIPDEYVALLFYMTFRDTIIYEPAELPASRYA